ncbi:unnamed protein product [Ascophyllum nodosum]
MKLSVFLVLLPSVSAFVTPSSPLSAVTTGLVNNVTPLRMTAENKGDNTEPWSVMKILRGVVGTASETKAKVDATSAEMYAELKKKVQVKKERQQLEGKLCSLIRIEKDDMSCKAEEHVRRLASNLEALQDNAAAFGWQRTGLAGSWKLMFSTCKADGKCEKKSDRLESIEEISYVSENLRLSHTDSGVLRVYKRVSGGVVKGKEDDTAQSSGVSSGTGKSKAGRASATAEGRSASKQPLRKRMFFGFLGR